MKPRLALFGTPHYSLIVFNELHKAGYYIVCVITKPPRPMGRKQVLTPTPVAEWASAKRIPLITPAAHPTKPWLMADEAAFTNNVLTYHPDLVIATDYTLKIPIDLLGQVKYGGLNIHPSLLPAYRGPAPVPWAILNGERETGVTIATLTEKFDEGNVIVQMKEPILPTDTTDSLLTKLFTKGVTLLTQILPQYVTEFPNYELRTANYKLIPSYFPRLTREIGFIPWEVIQAAMKNLHFPKNSLPRWPLAKYHDKTYLINNYRLVIINSYRALHPWPGLWTKFVIKGEDKRLKLLKLHLAPNRDPRTANLIIDQIQPEGKSPIPEDQTNVWLQNTGLI